MTGPDLDPVVHRAIEELRRLPTVERDAVTRVVSAAAAARVAPADGDDVLAIETPRRRSMRLWSALGMAAAAAIIGFVARGAWSTRSLAERERAVAAPKTVTKAPSAAATPLALAGAPQVAMVPRQFVLENTNARRIAVVGDFNNWNPAAAPMARPSGGGLWSVIVPIAPGRHVYGFMVDDSLFTLDPRVPKARDPDLGTEVSVLMVGRP